MNREISFRAWDKKEKKMLYPYIINFKLNGGIYVDDAYIQTETDLMHFFPPSEVNLMQFTGLKDKNGKKIYEGDIVKTHDRGKGKIIIGEVKYSLSIAGYYLKSINSTFRDKSLINNSPSLEILGNVYSNPKLLTDKVYVII